MTGVARRSRIASVAWIEQSHGIACPRQTEGAAHTDYAASQDRDRAQSNNP
jgi:hypothetical protein